MPNRETGSRRDRWGCATSNRDSQQASGTCTQEGEVHDCWKANAQGRREGSRQQRGTVAQLLGMLCCMRDAHINLICT